MALTQSEAAFVRRMAPHVEAGKTFAEAAQAVLDDDLRLYLALHNRDTGPAIRADMAAIVYRKIREGT